MQTLDGHLLDLLLNCTHAGADLVLLHIHKDVKNSEVAVKILDNGCGMDENTLLHAADKGFTTKNNAHGGMGLYLASEMCRKNGGNLRIKSKQGVYTLVTCRFKITKHLLPAGNWPLTVALWLYMNPKADIWVQYSTENFNKQFVFSRYARKTGIQYVKSNRDVRLVASLLDEKNDF
ncbi:MAG: ATP-binding protein [Bacteroidales bacterium]|nr:ATP-binding protein [Bacteroidales bacterium]